MEKEMAKYLLIHHLAKNKQDERDRLMAEHGHNC